MRHVWIPTSLTARTEPFGQSTHLEPFRRVWDEYVRCRADTACALCAPSHITDARWRKSSLARAAIADADSLQWRPPPPLGMFGASGEKAGRGGVAYAARTSPALNELWASCVAYGASATSGKVAAAAAAPSCLRGRWERNVSAFLASRKGKGKAAAG